MSAIVPSLPSPPCSTTAPPAAHVAHTCAERAAGRARWLRRSVSRYTRRGGRRRGGRRQRRRRRAARSRELQQPGVGMEERAVAGAAEEHLGGWRGRWKLEEARRAPRIARGAPPAAVIAAAVRSAARRRRGLVARERRGDETRTRWVVPSVHRVADNATRRERAAERAQARARRRAARARRRRRRAHRLSGRSRCASGAANPTREDAHPRGQRLEQPQRPRRPQRLGERVEERGARAAEAQRAAPRRRRRASAHAQARTAATRRWISSSSGSAVAILVRSSMACASEVP